jgi:cobalamin biosynthesis protein CobD/CbiB
VAKYEADIPKKRTNTLGIVATFINYCWRKARRQRIIMGIIFCLLVLGNIGALVLLLLKVTWKEKVQQFMAEAVFFSWTYSGLNAVKFSKKTTSVFYRLKASTPFYPSLPIITSDTLEDKNKILL